MAIRTPSRRANSSEALKWLSQAEQIKLMSLLLEARPELQAEADALALKMMTAVDPEAVAAQVVWAFQGFDQEEIRRLTETNRNARGKAISATAVAQQLCEERFDPLMERLERLISMGQMEAALAQVKGLLFGLYRLEAKVPPEAADFPFRVGAIHILEIWAKKAPLDMGPVMADWFQLEAPVDWASDLDTLWRRLRVRSRKPV